MSHPRLFLAAAILGSAVATAAADEPKPPPRPTPPPGTPAEQVKALIGRYDAAFADFLKQYKAAKSDEDKEKLMGSYPDREAYAAVLLEIAEKDPKDPAAFDALLWAASHARAAPTDPVFVKARDALARDHLADPRIGPFCRALRYDDFDPAAIGILRAVLMKNPNKEAQAQAAFTLATVLQGRAAFAESMTKKFTPEVQASFEKAYGQDTIAALKREDPAALRKEYEQLLERVVADKDYAATVIDRGEAKVTIGELADRELFAYRHLQPGKPAPDIDGEDIDGVKFKLSDYRGKVVLLDFWGHW